MTPTLVAGPVLLIQPPLEASVLEWEHRGARRYTVCVDVGPLGSEHIVPPAGEDYAFDVNKWRYRVQIGASPTGRAVSIWVNGKKIWKGAK